MCQCYNADRPRSGWGQAGAVGGWLREGFKAEVTPSSLNLATARNNWGLKGVKVQNPPCYSIYGIVSLR